MVVREQCSGFQMLCARVDKRGLSVSQYRYEYNRDSQTLEQIDEVSGKLVSSLSLPASDLQKISFLDWALTVDEVSASYQEVLTEA